MDISESVGSSRAAGGCGPAANRVASYKKTPPALFGGSIEHLITTCVVYHVFTFMPMEKTLICVLVCLRASVRSGGGFFDVRKC